MKEVIDLLNTPLFIWGGAGVSIATILGVILSMVLPNTKSNRVNSGIIETQKLEIHDLKKDVEFLKKENADLRATVNAIISNSTNKKINALAPSTEVPPVVEQAPTEQPTQPKQKKAKKVKVKKGKVA